MSGPKVSRTPVTVEVQLKACTAVLVPIQLMAAAFGDWRVCQLHVGRKSESWQRFRKVHAPATVQIWCGVVRRRLDWLRKAVVHRLWWWWGRQFASS